jgi:cadherin-like protein
VTFLPRRGATIVMACLLALAPIAAHRVAADGLAADDPYAMDEDASGGLVVPVESGVLANDTGGSLILCVSSFDTTGLVGTLLDPGLAPDGSFTYTPPPNFNGTTTFTYDVATMVGGVCPPPPTAEGTATVTIMVNAVNDPPAAAADSFTALKDRTLNVAAPGVLRNDSDVDGDSLSAEKVNSPSHGVVTLASDGSFSYTPNSGYVGPDAFSYRAVDPSVAKSPQRVVSLSVVAVPPPPTPTPAPTPTAAPTAAPTPEPSASESPAPSDSGFIVPSVGPSESAAASPTAGPAGGPVSGQGGPPLVAIGALALLVGLLAVAAVYFVRSQRTGDEDDTDDPFESSGRYDEIADDELPNDRIRERD